MFWMLTTPHEFAHAWVATKLGDDTPSLEGRVTLNPARNIDPWGSVLMPAISFLFGGMLVLFLLGVPIAMGLGLAAV